MVSIDTVASDPNGIYVWLIWLLPFIGALIIPGVVRISKYVPGLTTGRVAIAFAAMSAVSAGSLFLGALEGLSLIHI